MHTNSLYSTARQRGGTFLGLVLGVLIGLFAALAVAVYVTKVPIPFSKRNNTVMGSIEQEQAKNQDWDPNAPLAGKKSTSVRTNAEIAAAQAEAGSTTTSKTGKIDLNAPNEAAAAAATEAKAKVVLKPSPKPALNPDSDDPLADLLKSKVAVAPSPKPLVLQGDLSSAVTAEPFIYYVQIGAFVNNEEAESQRAKAAMAGFDARVSEREQAGRQVFRVRLGPFDSKDLADRTKASVQANGLDAALVRVQR